MEKMQCIGLLKFYSKAKVICALGCRFDALVSGGHFIATSRRMERLTLLQDGFGAEVMKCKCWRKHSKDFAKGESPPKTIEGLQAAWDRDQELIFEQKEEISRLKREVNNLKQENRK